MFESFLIGIFLLDRFVNAKRISDLDKKINRLANQLSNKSPDNLYTNQAPIPAPEQVQETQNFIHSPWNQKSEEAIPKPVKTTSIQNSEPESTQIKKEEISFEQQFGARLPIWIGGIALALAGFFMVKYSIEIGLLTPAMRVILGIVFSFVLLYSADLVRKKPNFSNGRRISQALSGAAIADLYICIFSATNLYNLIPAPVGFVAMALITALAVALSLKYGLPIAFLGLVGGFLTPIMIGSDNPSTLILLVYLYFIFAGLMFVIRKQSWWIMLILAVLGSFFWASCLLFGSHFLANDSIWLALFLVAISTTVIVASKEEYQKESNNNLFNITSALNVLTLVGAFLLLGAIVAKSNFGVMEFGLFFLVALGGVALAYFNQKLYGFVPWFSMALNAIMLMAWGTSDVNLLASTIVMFGGLYIAGGYVLQARSAKPLMFVVLSCAASVGYYLIGYYKLLGTELLSNISLFWGLLALAFAAIKTYALQNIIKQIPEDHPQKQHLLAIYALTITTFISLGLTIELPYEFLPIAIVAEIFFIALINNKINIEALRKIAGILLGIFGLLLLPQLVTLFYLAINSLVDKNLILQNNVAIANSPIIQLGIPALLLVISSFIMGKKEDDSLNLWLEIIASSLGGAMLYYLSRDAFNTNQGLTFSNIGFIERGVITSILFAYALLCLWISREFSRRSFYLVGSALVIISISRIICFDLLIYNPIWSSQLIGDLPILNGLLITYFLPILLTLRLIFELSDKSKAELRLYLQSFVLLISFVFVSLNVRQFFHGTHLNEGITTSAEVYSYSAAWILFSATLLFIGITRQDKMVRISSLVMMSLAVGKVFLYDASELEGLLRVISFLGLGISLMIIGWLYMKFVLKNEGN